MRLEWRALVRALGDSGEARTRAVRDALAFRATRRSQFREAAEDERREEIREGIAHYTGIVATAASRPVAVARTIAHVMGAEGHETFLQQSYTTGTAYGVLLDDASADWRRRVRSDSDGWAVTVAPGWTVRPGPRSGDYRIVREPHLVNRNTRPRGFARILLDLLAA